MNEPALRRCTSSCHEGPNPLPPGEFPRNRGKRDGLSNHCRMCARERVRRWKEANPERVRESNRSRPRDPEGTRERSRRWREAHPEQARQARLDYTARLRDEVFDHYGRTCSCCDDTEDLTIDHVGGGGGAHRTALFGRRNGGGEGFYRWLIQNDFPSGYQVLCRPCNASKADGAACRLDHNAAA